MTTHANNSPPKAPRPATAEPRRYEPPRLSGKQALQQVTLFSTPSCTPGAPGCSIGHP